MCNPWYLTRDLGLLKPCYNHLATGKLLCTDWPLTFNELPVLHQTSQTSCAIVRHWKKIQWKLPKSMKVCVCMWCLCFPYVTLPSMSQLCSSGHFEAERERLRQNLKKWDIWFWCKTICGYWFLFLSSGWVLFFKSFFTSGDYAHRVTFSECFMFCGSVNVCVRQRKKTKSVWGFYCA